MKPIQVKAYWHKAIKHYPVLQCSSVTNTRKKCKNTKIPISSVHHNLKSSHDFPPFFQAMCQRPRAWRTTWISWGSRAPQAGAVPLSLERLVLLPRVGLGRETGKTQPNTQPGISPPTPSTSWSPFPNTCK